MYIERNIEARWRNHFGKALSFTYSHCVFVALGIQYAMRRRGTVNCGLSGCTVFLYINSYTARFLERKFIDQNICVSTFSTTFI